MARRFPTSPLNFRMRSRIHAALMAHSGRLRTVTVSPAAAAPGTRTRCWPVRVPHSTSLHIHRSSEVRRRLDYSTIVSFLDQLLFGVETLSAVPVSSLHIETPQNAFMLLVFPNAARPCVPVMFTVVWRPSCPCMLEGIRTTLQMYTSYSLIP